ncbi:MAG: hypothetical protein RLZZ385_608 [Pseudomonadota bacterium]|jgi:NAD(P)H-hydrate epimerase
MDSHSHLPRDLYTAAQTRQLDQLAIEEAGIPAFELMRRAGQVAFDVLLQRWPQVRRLQVFAGAGNNGGDGYVVAALARQLGLQVQLFRVGDHSRLAGAALAAAQLAAEAQVPMEDFAVGEFPSEDLAAGHTVVVDALLGTGVDRPLSGDYRAAVERINTSAAPVLAIDIPSGLCSDTGCILGIGVMARVTVTFITLKQGMLTLQGVAHCGDIVHHDLDVPTAVYQHHAAPRTNCHRIDMAAMSGLLRSRSPASHKGNFGHVVVLGGELGYGGAAIMAAQAALRSGAGLVSLVTRPAHCVAALARQPELMVLGTDGVDAAVDELLQRATVLVVGPGLGRTPWSRQLLQAAMTRQAAADLPLVVDADGLNLLAERGHGVAGVRRRQWILTPHPGEAARLLDTDIGKVQADRFAAVRALQRRWGGTCLLKGAGSLLCHATGEGQVLQLCTEGNAGMASGGMGDVLSGIIGGLLAQGWDSRQALALGVCVHGESGDLAAAAGGQRGLAATDLLPRIRGLLNTEAH